MARILHERADAIPLLAEVFREHGFEGASLSLIHKKTGLGRGSLYHFFPGGKEEMADAVLEEIDAWFEQHVFAPLASADEPLQAVEQMFVSVEEYFQSGQRVCIVGTFALSDTRDKFAHRLNSYFRRWIEALSIALGRLGYLQPEALKVSEEVVSSIQGAIVLSRAGQDVAMFERIITRLKERILHLQVYKSFE